ncbi:MAG: hypothetical protein ACE5GK_02835, partial [Nitrospiria bacterium]
MRKTFTTKHKLLMAALLMYFISACGQTFIQPLSSSRKGKSPHHQVEAPEREVVEAPEREVVE